MKKIALIDDEQHWLNIFAFWAEKITDQVEVVKYLDPDEFLQDFDSLNLDCIISKV